jgi:hypothetical protein
VLPLAVSWMGHRLVALEPVVLIQQVRVDVEASGGLAKARLQAEPLDSFGCQCGGRVDADKLHAFAAILELVNVLQHKDVRHVVAESKFGLAVEHTDKLRSAT